MTTETTSSGFGSSAATLTLGQLDAMERALDGLKAVADILTSLGDRAETANIRACTLSWMGVVLLDSIQGLDPAITQIDRLFRKMGGNHHAAA